MRVVRIDPYQTKKINHDAEEISCNCSDCQRYCKLMKQLPASAEAFFKENGLEPMKCQELWAYHPNDNGYHHYCGYFNIAVCETESQALFCITEDWKTFAYDGCRFRVRLEYTTEGKPILGFEADLPILETEQQKG